MVHRRVLISQVILLFLAVTFGSNCIAQRLNFVTSTPNIDSFPVVKIKYTASYNGFPPVPAVAASDFTVTEDGQPITPEIVGCDGTRQSAVVFCTDASTSMRSTVGDSYEVYDVFYRCFGECFSRLGAGSRYALVTFTNKIEGVYPGPSHINGFFDQGNQTDSATFATALKFQPYFGGTNVDLALNTAVEMLRYQPFASKVIVLVTDDHTIDEKFYDSVLKSLNITLFVMEVGSDNSAHNLDLTRSSGGAYFQAPDSTTYAPVMSQIGELISSEHCYLRYVSPNPCPWYASHSINLKLDYNNLSRVASGSYKLFRNFRDKTGPLIDERSPFFTSRIITATEQFPCERGLFSALDSVRENFSLFRRRRAYTHFFPKINGIYVDSNYLSMEDSISVIDTMQPARAIYVAYDSAGNRSEFISHYAPQADILNPDINVAAINGPKYTIATTEAKPWDRGLKSIRLQNGSTNIILDSMRIYTKRTGNAWLHLIDPKLAAHGCIESEDSVGNIGILCVDKTVGPIPGDTLAPIITQSPIVFPKPRIIAQVAENRVLDKGIKTITVEPAANITVPAVSFASSKFATITIDITDTLEPVQAWVTAADSVGNVNTDTLRYTPLPDIASPNCSVDNSVDGIRTFHTVENSPWDRGIASVQLVGAPINFTVSPVAYTSRWDAEQTFTAINPSLSSSVVVKAIDSLGHECVTTISIEAIAKPIEPLQSDATIDFLSHLTPFDSTAIVTITNPNEQPVIVTKITKTGSGNFTTTLLPPLVFQPFESQTISVRFQSSELGDFSGQFELDNDTMPLAHLTMVGKTTGTAAIHLGTVTAPFSGTNENLSIKISSDPSPINLDDISFDLVFDGDLVDAAQPTVDCSMANPLCNYTMTVSPIASGILHVDLSRIDRTLLSPFNAQTAEILLPFTTYVSKNNTTTIIATNLNAGNYATLTADTGSISIGDKCAEASLRSYLNNNLHFTVESISPNPTSNDVRLVLDCNATEIALTVSIVDQLGRLTSRKIETLHQGKNTFLYNVNDLNSGNYILSIGTETTPNGVSLPLKIVH